MAEEEDKAPKGGKSKMMIFVIIGVVILLGAVGFAAYLYGQKTAQKAPGEEVELEETATSEGVGPMVDVSDFIINIIDKNETRYLKAAITLELENEEMVLEVNERMAQIRDSVLLLIGNKTFAELSDLQGKLQWRAEIMLRLNKRFKKGKVKGM